VTFDDVDATESRQNYESNIKEEHFDVHVIRTIGMFDFSHFYLKYRSTENSRVYSRFYSKFKRNICKK